MILYLDSSAFSKRHAPDEPDSEACSDLVERYETWVTSRISSIEVARALHRSLPPIEATDAIRRFDEDLRETNLITADESVCALARDIAIRTGVKTGDALHLASALTFPQDAVAFLTYDRQQSRAAQELGLRIPT
jgi:predicted nucleic acid-binding protein